MDVRRKKVLLSERPVVLAFSGAPLRSPGHSHHPLTRVPPPPERVRFRQLNSDTIAKHDQSTPHLTPRLAVPRKDCWKQASIGWQQECAASKWQFACCEAGGVLFFRTWSRKSDNIANMHRRKNSAPMPRHRGSNVPARLTSARC